MKIIKELSEMIEDEIEGAEHYAKLAVMHKGDMPVLAKTFYDISTDEMRHVDLLHSEVVKLIEEHRKTKGEPPASMLAVYDYLHERHIEKAKEVKLYQNQYKGIN
jgi:rubrerythrin